MQLSVGRSDGSALDCPNCRWRSPGLALFPRPSAIGLVCDVNPPCGFHLRLRQVRHPSGGPRSVAPRLKGSAEPASAQIRPVVQVYKRVHGTPALAPCELERCLSQPTAARHVDVQLRLPSYSTYRSPLYGSVATLTTGSCWESALSFLAACLAFSTA